jgi:hypothetical protein
VQVGTTTLATFSNLNEGPGRTCSGRSASARSPGRP